MPASGSFPTGGAYVEALQNPALCFSDSDLSRGRVALTKLHQPKPISGNFASVFSVTAPDGRRFAVKCFTHDTTGQRARYEAISHHLSRVDNAMMSQPWKMDFAYLPDGILVNGRRWPVLKMAWVDGVGLLGWLDAHRWDRAALWNLADRFAALVADLERTQIGHGDLQHGNLLVAADGGLRLVDYDGMYVPALAACPAVEDGHRHYQSPQRGAGDFGETVDRFSAWVIYLSLVALATDPTLWDTLRTRHDEHLLTCDEDYKAPLSSWRLTQLAAAGSEVGHLALRVRDLAGLPIRSIPPLVPVARAAAGSVTSATGTSATWTISTTANTSSTANTSMGSGRPAWLDTQISLQQAAAVHNTAPIALPGFGGGRRAIDVLASLTGVLLILLAVFALAVAPVTAVADVFLLLCSSMFLDAGRRSRPEWKAWRAAVRVQSVQLKASDTLRTQLRTREQKQTSDMRDLEQRAAKAAKSQQELHSRRTAELANVDRQVAKVVGDVDRERRDLEAQQARRLSNELDRVRRDYVRAQLRRYTVHSGVREINGLGTAAANALGAIGVYTAQDINITFQAGGSGYSSRMAFFVLPNGTSTRVSGIGEAKGKALLEWRDRLARRAEQSAPTVLPAATIAQLRSFEAPKIDALKARRAATDVWAHGEKMNVNQRSNQESARLKNELQVLQTQRISQEADLRSLQADLRDAEQERTRVRDVLAAQRRTRRRISSWRYLRFVLLDR